MHCAAKGSGAAAKSVPNLVELSFEPFDMAHKTMPRLNVEQNSDEFVTPTDAQTMVDAETLRKRRFGSQFRKRDLGIEPELVKLPHVNTSYQSGFKLPLK